MIKNIAFKIFSKILKWCYIQLYKDEVYIYPDNISPVSVDEMFTLNFNENIDFEKIMDRFNNEVEEEELEEGV